MRGTALKVVAALLVVWLVMSVVGALVRGLFWLTVVGVLLFAGTAVYGYLRRRSPDQRSLP
ncbi:MAG: hypothetical protein NTW05_16440 [Pseudonocardiales bacterium]|jgi:hypothetical protein|nr:hypothetical protein [Pseudonocardiales bacterium]